MEIRGQLSVLWEPTTGLELVHGQPTNPAGGGGKSANVTWGTSFINRYQDQRAALTDEPCK